MSETTVPKAVRAEPVETDARVEQTAQQPSGPGNREGGGEWPEPGTPPTSLKDYDPQRVPVNMYETEDALVLVLPLPGVMADDVSIDIEDDRVHVNAAQRTAAEKDYIAHEWHYGPYERMVAVPRVRGCGLGDVRQRPARHPDRAGRRARRQASSAARHRRQLAPGKVPLWHAPSVPAWD